MREPTSELWVSKKTEFILLPEGVRVLYSVACNGTADGATDGRGRQLTRRQRSTRKPRQWAEYPTISNNL